MMLDLQQIISDANILRKGYIIRDGFVFTKLTYAPIFDCLVIRYPADAVGSSLHSPVSGRSLEEHIRLIQDNELEKAMIICNDLSFINMCPSLKSIAVYPSLEANNGFDFSPLYKMPNIRELFCATNYGHKEQLHSCVDYSKVRGVSCVYATGIGQLGYEDIPHLEKLWLSGSRRHNDLTDISCSKLLHDVTIMNCNLKSLSGLNKHPKIQHLALYNCRSLSDISPLKCLTESLKTLTIERCPKIADFSALNELYELEYLQLCGSNTIPNLQFLSGMKKLKIFCFTVNVLDGDLTLCKDIPYVSCKNRKHYNFKDQSLPKELPQ